MPRKLNEYQNELIIAMGKTPSELLEMGVSIYHVKRLMAQYLYPYNGLFQSAIEKFDFDKLNHDCAYHNVYYARMMG